MVIAAIFVVIGVTQVIPSMAQSGGTVWGGLLWTLISAATFVLNLLNLLDVMPRQLEWFYRPWPMNGWGYEVEEVDDESER